MPWTCLVPRWPLHIIEARTFGTLFSHCTHWGLAVSGTGRTSWSAVADLTAT